MKKTNYNINIQPIDDYIKVLEYLKKGRVIAIASGLENDKKDPSKGNVVNIGIVTDGVWVWPLALNYYIEQYHLGIEEEFLKEIRSKNYQCPSITDGQLENIRKDVLGIPVSNSNTAMHSWGEEI